MMFFSGNEDGWDEFSQGRVRVKNKTLFTGVVFGPKTAAEHKKNNNQKTSKGNKDKGYVFGIKSVGECVKGLNFLWGFAEICMTGVIRVRGCWEIYSVTGILLGARIRCWGERVDCF